MSDNVKKRIITLLAAYLNAHGCVTHPESKAEFAEKIVGMMKVKKLSVEKIATILNDGGYIIAWVKVADLIADAYASGDLFEDTP